MSKKVLFVLAVVAFSIVLAGCGLSNNQSQQTKEPIKIGALFPLTGGLAMYGDPAQKVATIAMEEINASGGINGHKVEINFQDHQCKAPMAVSIFQQLSGTEAIKLYTSVACSGTVLGTAPLLGDDHLLLGTLITASTISGVSPSVFRNYASDADAARLFAEYILQKGFKKVAIIYEETDYAKGLKLGVEAGLKGKSIAIASESYLPDSADIRSQLAKLKATNPEVLFISPQTETAADRILKQMKEINFKPKNLIVNENIYRSANLNKTYPDLLSGAISVDYVTADNDKRQHVLDAYKAKYGADCPQINVCLNVYDNIYMLAEAAGQSDLNIAKTREYLKNIQYSGAGGEVSFDDQNDRSNAHFTLFEIKDGKGVKLETK